MRSFTRANGPRPPTPGRKPSQASSLGSGPVLLRHAGHQRPMASVRSLRKCKELSDRPPRPKSKPSSCSHGHACSSQAERRADPSASRPHIAMALAPGAFWSPLRAEHARDGYLPQTFIGTGEERQTRPILRHWAAAPGFGGVAASSVWAGACDTQFLASSSRAEPPRGTSRSQLGNQYPGLAFHLVSGTGPVSLTAGGRPERAGDTAPLRGQREGLVNWEACSRTGV